MRARIAMVVVLAAVVVACSRDKPEVPLPTVTGPDPDAVIYTQPDTPVTITLTLTDAAGAPATGYGITWGPFSDSGDAAAGFIATPSHDGPGLESITVQASLVNDYGVGAQIDIPGDLSGRQILYGSPTIRVYGGAPTQLIPMSWAVDLAVGEARPVGGMGFAPTFTPQHYANEFATSDQPVTYRIDDPAVATVSADGVVTGVTPGTANLTLACGMVSTSLIVTVTAGTPGPPTLGKRRFDGGPVANPPPYAIEPTVGHGIGNIIDRRLQVDSHGNPYLVETPFVGLDYFGQIPVVLWSWTGTGFGTERVNDLKEHTYSPKLDIDERDQLYVIYLSDRDAIPGFIVAERAASAGPGTWQYHRLDGHFPDLDAVGGELRGYDRNFDSEISASLPRAGGGLWVAWSQGLWISLLHVKVPGHEDADCVNVIHLAQIAPDGTTTQEQVSAIYWTFPPTGGECGDYLEDPDSTAMQLLPPGPGEDRPEIALVGELDVTKFTSGHLDLTSGLTIRHHTAAGGWTLETKLAPSPTVTDLHALQPAISAVRPAQPGGPTLLVATGYAPVPVQALGSGFDHEVGAIGGVGDQASVTSRHTFGFQTEDFLYLSGAGILSLLRYDRFGGPSHEDSAFFAWEPGGVREPPPPPTSEAGVELSGFAVGGGLMHMLTSDAQGAPELRTRTLPARPPTSHDPESTGVRLGDADFTPAILHQQPIVLADGTRYVLTDSLGDAFLLPNGHYNDFPGNLLRSAGPGQPFVVKSTRDISTELAPTTELTAMRHVFVVGADLYSIQLPGDANGIWEVVRSIDQGATWQVWNANILTSALALLRPVKITKAGAAYAVPTNGGTVVGGQLSDFDLLFAADVTSPTAKLATLGGLGAVKTSIPGTVLVPSGSDPFGIAETADGVWLAVLLAADTQPAVQSRILVRRYVGATLAEEHLWPIAKRPRMQDMTFVDGALYFHGDVTIVAFEELYRLDPTTGALTTTHLNELMWNQPPPIIALTDGRLVLAYTTDVAVNVIRAVYRLSSDHGATWSAPIQVRPVGGFGQLFSGIAAEPGGGFLAAVGDNAALQPWTDTVGLATTEDEPPGTHVGDAGMTPVQWMMMHVDP